MNMKRIVKKEFNLNQSSPREYDLNKSSTGCAPCKKEASKIERKIDNRELSKIKIEEVKNIARSIFESEKYGYKKN